MRKVLASLAAVAMVAALGASLRAESKTVKGEVIDVKCQTKKAENVGSAHADCALSCAKRGATMGIMTPDGVYTITGDYTADNNKKLIDFVASAAKHDRLPRLFGRVRRMVPSSAHGARAHKRRLRAHFLHEPAVVADRHHPGAECGCRARVEAM